MTRPSELRYRIAGRTGQLLFDALFATTRLESSGEHHFRQFMDSGRPVIFILWHGRLLPLTYDHRGEDLVTLVSQSGDGEYITRIIQHWGYVVVRGSSSRGAGRALRQLVRHVRAGRSLAITPDGPRGPRQEIKPGALLAAQLSGAPLIPAVCAADRSWWFTSWDRFLVPQPFSRIILRYGAPLFVSPQADAEALERARQTANAALNALQAEVDAEVQSA